MPIVLQEQRICSKKWIYFRFHLDIKLFLGALCFEEYSKGDDLWRNNIFF
jgi:hypothetical protein